GGRGVGSGRSRGFKKPKAYLVPNGHDWLSADSGGNTSQFSEEEIHALLAGRLQAKFARDFCTADGIQAELIDGGGVEWRPDGVPYGSFRGGGDRSRDAEHQRYTQSLHSADVEGASDALIDKLVAKRTKFKLSQQYDKADTVREGLCAKFNVLIDDRLKQWSAGGDFGKEHNAQLQLAVKFTNQGYVKWASSMSLDDEEEEYIQHHVDVRAQAKKDRDFEAADKIHKQKLWSIGGVFEELGGKVGKPRGVYTRRDVGDLSVEDVELISRMISERYHAKKQRQFDVADDIRDELRRTYNVNVDDRSNEWRVDTDDYAMSGDNDLSDEDVEFVDSKLKERFRLKIERLYEDADSIRDDLKARFGVSIDDRTKEWFVDSEFAVASEESVAI
ncbi:hypothetical protein ACHAWF_003457, partial [Thalassiosira exigua]